MRCGSVARKVLVRTLSGKRKPCRSWDGLRGEPLQRIVRIGHRIDDAVRRDRHGAHRAARIVVYVTVGVTELCEIRVGHGYAAGVFRHAALAVVGIVGNNSNGILDCGIRGNQAINTNIFFMTHQKQSYNEKIGFLNI